MRCARITLCWTTPAHTNTLMDGAADRWDERRGSSACYRVAVVDGNSGAFMWRYALVLCALAWAIAVSRSGWAIPVNANTLSLNSGGLSGTNAVLSKDGYAGTYINVPGGPVTITLTATPTAGGGPAPHMNIVVADTKVGCDLSAAGSNSCVASIPNLPAGNYCLNDGSKTLAFRRIL
jgi:hypothetical protein